MDDRAERFTSLYREHYPAVLAYAARRSDASTAQDVAAHVFLVAWRRLDDVPRAHVLPWLLRTARLTLGTTARGQRRGERLARRAAVDEATPPGGLSTMWELGSLSSDPGTLAAQLERGHPVGNGPAERLVAITDLAREQPLPPPVRAAVLRYLAATPGLRLTGAVDDRSGRPGLAVHLDTDHGGLPNRDTLIIDAVTGTLLGSEEMLTEDPGLLDVPIPSVISYTTYVDARYVDSTSD